MSEQPINILAGRRSPVAGRRSPVAGRRSPVAGRRRCSREGEGHVKYART